MGNKEYVDVLSIYASSRPPVLFIFTGMTSYHYILSALPTFFLSLSSLLPLRNIFIHNCLHTLPFTCTLRKFRSQTTQNIVRRQHEMTKWRHLGLGIPFCDSITKTQSRRREEEGGSVCLPSNKLILKQRKKNAKIYN